MLHNIRCRVAGLIAFVIVVTVIIGSPLTAAEQKQRKRTPPAKAQPPTISELFEVHEQSILDLQNAMASGRVTSRGLVESYLARIQAYDQVGPRLNAIVLINPRARED